MGNLSFRSTTSTENENGLDFHLIEETLSFNKELGIRLGSIISRIRVILKPETIALELEFNYERSNSRRIDYTNHEQGCLMEWCQDNCHNTFKEKILNVDYAEMFMKDLDLILRTQKSILEVFEIDFRSGHLHTIEQNQSSVLIIDQFLTKVEHVLNEKLKRERPLKVKFFSMNQIGKFQFLKILRYIDAEKIQKISISDAKERYQMLAVECFEELEQWKKAKEVGLMYYDMSIPTQYFWSFNFVKLATKSRQKRFDS
ncbi:unnamed protein product [Caenorhabditis brenneri]